MLTRIKPVLVIFAFLFIGLYTTHAAAQGAIKIAFVDLRRALFETEDGKKAKAKLEGLQTQLQKQISEKEKGILAMKDTLEKQQNVLTKDAMQKKAEEYYRSVQELQQLYMSNQKELGAKEAQLTQDILAKLEGILGEIGKGEGYTMIYDRSSGAVVWAPSHLDLTDKVIQMYNGKYKGGGGAGAAKPK